MNAASKRLPALFVGHGSPTNALESNPFTAAWQRLGQELPRPRAILAVSAHWYTRGSFVTVNARPPTIHDFGGFARELYEVQYPAPGDPALAARVAELLRPVEVGAATDWGLDHGTWSVLVHAYPQADVPVVQLSIDADQPATVHYALGKRLAALRDEGILVVGSGGIVHNLRRLARERAAPPPVWAAEFDQWVRDHIERREHAALLDLEVVGEGARVSVPTPEHYLPLLYVLGAQGVEDTASFPVSGFDLGSLSMTSVLVGASP
jgi:4,5-DOPA dioxygenase extradiol